jgi:hypothetical protein
MSRRIELQQACLCASIASGVSLFFGKDKSHAGGAKKTQVVCVCES